MMIRIGNNRFLLSGNFLFSLRLRLGLWESGSFKVLDYYLKKDRSFIDMGAWIGPLSLYAQRSCKKVYAIEPDPVSLRFLKENIFSNKNEEKIEIFPFVISDKDGEVILGTPKRFGDSRSSILGKMKSKISVRAFSFDSFVRRKEVKDCNLIKMDIEGGEEIVVPSMRNYLRKNKPTLLLSLHPDNFTKREKVLDEILDVLRMYEYIYYTNGERITLKRIKKDLRNRRLFKEIVFSDIEWKV